MPSLRPGVRKNGWLRYKHFYRRKFDSHGFGFPCDTGKRWSSEKEGGWKGAVMLLKVWFVCNYHSQLKCKYESSSGLHEISESASLISYLMILKHTDVWQSPIQEKERNELFYSDCLIFPREPSKDIALNFRPHITHLSLFPFK